MLVVHGLNFPSLQDLSPAGETEIFFRLKRKDQAAESFSLFFALRAKSPMTRSIYRATKGKKSAEAAQDQLRRTAVRSHLPSLGANLVICGTTT